MGATDHRTAWGVGPGAVPAQLTLTPVTPALRDSAGTRPVSRSSFTGHFSPHTKVSPAPKGIPRPSRPSAPAAITDPGGPTKLLAKQAKQPEAVCSFTSPVRDPNSLATVENTTQSTA